MRIYVGGISYNASNDTLRHLFETVGTVSEVRIVLDRQTNQSRCFGFVEMPDDSEARAAIAMLDGHAFDGRNLAVLEANSREEKFGGIFWGGHG